MILYVLYEDFGGEGCSDPKAVTDQLSIAENWSAKSEVNIYMELELNDLSGLRSMRTSSGDVDIEKIMKSYVNLELEKPTIGRKITNI